MFACHFSRGNLSFLSFNGVISAPLMLAKCSFLVCCICYFWVFYMNMLFVYFNYCCLLFILICAGLFWDFFLVLFRRAGILVSLFDLWFSILPLPIWVSCFYKIFAFSLNDVSSIGFFLFWYLYF